MEEEIYIKIEFLKKEIKFLSKKKLLKAYQNVKMRTKSLEKEIEKLELQVKHQYDLLTEKDQCLTKKDNDIERIKKLHDDSSAENAHLKQLVKNKENYENDQWATGWIEYWKKYFYENYNVFEQKLTVLKEKLDLISQGTIDLLLERNIHIFPIQKYTKNFLYDYDRIYLPWEIEGMKCHFSERDAREKYGIAEEVYLEMPVFHFHCGLKCLPVEILKQIKGRDIIDGGAFWGDSALVFQDYLPAKIYAFEPQKENYRRLCETKEKRGVKELIPVNIGLGEKNEEAVLHFHEMLSGASVINYKALSWENDKENTNEIKITTIDDYVEKNNLDVAVIKLDIEGNELEAIKGALKTIRKYKPILLISVYHLPKDLFEIKPLIESLNLGYEFMFRKLVFHDPLTEVSLIGYVPETEE